MRCSFGFILLGLIVLHVSGSGRLVKRQDRLVGLLTCSTNAGANGTCVPVGSCLGLISTTANTCPLQSGNNETGVCCPLTSQAGVQAQPAALTVGGEVEEQVRSREEIERLLLERGLFVQPGTAEALHNVIVLADPVSQSLSQESRRITAILRTTTPVPGNLTTKDVFSRPRTPAHCIELQSSCLDRNKYRTYDGSCNNLRNADWGKAHTAFRRLMPPLYADGISKPRRSANETALPSARLVSTTILNSDEVELSNVSLFFTAFGQFVDHDLTLTPVERVNNAGIRCCPPEITSELRHPECMTIDIPAGDPFYGQFNQRCMEFVRTIAAPRKHCASLNEPRQQMNQLTNYIDASMIYGSDETKAEQLRSKSGGKLLAGEGPALNTFPPSVDGPACSGDGQRHHCFFTGDGRSSEQPSLVTLHVAFFREHNRIAGQLAELNPKWEDQVLYQETRRIIGAIVQHIIYNEYLPVILGNDTMQNFSLMLHPEGFWDPYDPNVDASILNEFATAAFRFAHSAVPSLIKLVDGNNNETVQLLRDHFLKPYDVNLFNDYARGSLAQSSNFIDESFTLDLTDHLFQRNGRFGLDLAALNIQRGRDHAIGTYTQAHKVCGLEDVTSFEDLSKFMDSRIADRFSELYDDVEDIDLWIGGVVEKPLPGAAVGPTFACIIAEQFKRTRIGDRFWYERGNTDTSFTKDQLREIRQSSLARILCDNSDISKVQPLALLKPMAWNSPVECDSDEIPQMSFLPWRNETVGFNVEKDFQG